MVERGVLRGMDGGDWWGGENVGWWKGGLSCLVGNMMRATYCVIGDNGVDKWRTLMG